MLRSTSQGTTIPCCFFGATTSYSAYAKSCTTECNTVGECAHETVAKSAPIRYVGHVRQAVQKCYEVTEIF